MSLVFFIHFQQCFSTMYMFCFIWNNCFIKFLKLSLKSDCSTNLATIILFAKFAFANLAAKYSDVNLSNSNIVVM